jgi:hypothetical protein
LIFQGGIVNKLVRKNRALAKKKWSNQLNKLHFESLNSLSEEFGFSVALNDLLLLQGNWYVTAAGLLRLAQRSHCSGIRTRQVPEFCDSLAGRWVFRAMVYKSPQSRGFEGYGDADPSNVSSMVRGAEMRVAETRAVNRALRKAYGIGLCSVEELSQIGPPPNSDMPDRSSAPTSNGHRPGNGLPSLRDRLCLLVREHHLDANLVKKYAADFCGTQELRTAKRELVESFVVHISEWAARDHATLVSKLESYSMHVETRS